jgi:2-O-methyltransferase
VTVALTSLAPGQAGSEAVHASIRSWRAAGLDVVAFNHPSEVSLLQTHHDVEFVPVAETSEAMFGRRCVPISTMVRWASERDLTALLLNSDIELRLAASELERLSASLAGGLCYLVRHNHLGVLSNAVREPFGIDGFLFCGRDLADLPESFLSMGQPFWDYWLPYVYASRGAPLSTPAFPAAFHRSHANQWSWETWFRCGTEFARLVGERRAPEDHDECQALARRARSCIDAATTPFGPRPWPIRDWVEATFAGTGDKLFIEAGSHDGSDTAWLAALPGVTMHAFEPDPRNTQPALPNVTVHRAALWAEDGCGQLILSREGWGREWTYSSSLRRPKHHLQRFPVTFGEAVEVELVTLDSFSNECGIEHVDLIWADVQGAEGDVIRGGPATLARTRYLYTEYSDDELYEGQSSLGEILELLPDFRVLELWPDDVLLENRGLAA